MLHRKIRPVRGKSLWGACCCLFRVMREGLPHSVMTEQRTEETKEQAMEPPALLEHRRKKVQQVQ